MTEDEKREARRVALGWPPGYFDDTFGSCPDLERPKMDFFCEHIDDYSNAFEFGRWNVYVCPACAALLIDALREVR
ncbi:hypothetical protein LCGC14_2589720 [marine sediment metagenome]|uniref:Uncharacterized protein n=1 Tax=marine sediment metagenome TaxID=412755 RepID=A0A0F9ABY4_9ZZZZ